MKKIHKKPVKALALICLVLAAFYVVSIKSNITSGITSGIVSQVSTTQMAEIERIKNELQVAQIQLQQATDLQNIKKIRAKIAALQAQLIRNTQPITPRPVFRS